MLWRHTFSGSAALLLAFHCSAVAQQFSFRHYGAADGLQNLTILSLAQDGAGYLWAGSEGGLYRYDGTRFRLMAAAEGTIEGTGAPEGHAGLPQMDTSTFPSQVFWLAVTFGLLFVVLSRMTLPMIAGSIGARRNRIASRPITGGGFGAIEAIA